MTRTLIPVDIGQAKPYEVEITRHDVPMRGLPGSLHGATFAHISDLHGGFAGLEAVYEETIARVNAENVDFLFITGDYVDDHKSIKAYPMQDYLRRFEAKQGVFGCLGNHENRRGPVQARKMLDQSGLRLLVNENLRTPTGLWIAGIDDFFEGKPDLAATLKGVPDDVTAIVLSHNPRLIEKVGDRDLLLLSGHTHGGQINLPFPTPKMVCWFHLRVPQVAGWFRNGRARCYVSRGVGVTGKPFRYRCPAEIGFFRLLPDKE